MRVLVVEDETKVASAVKRGLSAEGYAVDIAATGTDGLWLAEQNPYDILILDIMLPGITGYELCSRLRAQSIWTPILILTAKDGDLDEAHALDTGADDFLSKPFSFVVLLARVRALLRRGRSERPTLLEAGDLRLDPAAHRCWREGEEVRLTAREFAVLEYLLRQAGDVVAKAAILENVWDFSFAGDPNIVEVYIPSPAQEDRRAVRPARHRDRARSRLPNLGRWRLTEEPSPGVGSGRGRTRCARARRSPPPWWLRSRCWPERSSSARCRRERSPAASTTRCVCGQTTSAPRCSMAPCRAC